MTPSVSVHDGPAAEWNAFVRRQPGWTSFHLFEWQRVIDRVFAHETYYLAARTSAGVLCGVLPLVRVRSRLFGHYLVSMPFVNYGGPLGGPTAIEALCDRAVTIADESGADLLELRSRQALPTGLPVTHRKVTVLLDLTGENPVWDRLPAKVRSQVRRPAKAGVTYSFGPDQLDAFYGVYVRHMRDLGSPAQPKQLFTELRDAFGDDVWFGSAILDGVPIAAGCGFRWAAEFEMTWAAACLEHKRTSANMGLYWAFMERAMHAGVDTFNFGRCTPGSGTHRFKRQWGTRDEPLWWYTHARSPEAVATPAPTDDRWSWGPRIWRRLPLAVAAAAGPRIVRYIP